jgi:hypothetical protein
MTTSYLAKIYQRHLMAFGKAFADSVVKTGCGQQKAKDKSIELEKFTL